MTTRHTDTTQALPTGTWQLDPAKTTVTVTAKKLGAFRVPATLTVTSGVIEIDASHQVTAVDVVVDASSYTSRNPKRDDHIRSGDFLDVDQHPNLVFRAGSVTPTAAGYRADGSVTVKAETFPLSVDISNVAFDTRRGSFVATASIDRKTIGVDKLPAFVIGRDLQLTVAAEAIPTGT